jgi:hypothetical protein
MRSPVQDSFSLETKVVDRHLSIHTFCPILVSLLRRRSADSHGLGNTVYSYKW